ncbi:MAG: BatD family protein, partial [Bdellovibrionales bacterium]|nr:BatD family protein [Bdellovibrionales bacterium]
EIQYDNKAVDYGQGKELVYKIISSGNLNPIQELPITKNNEFKVYSSTAYSDSKILGDKIEFSKSFPVTIIPLRGGVVKIPPIKLSYFDPDALRYETAISEEVDISVIGGFQTPTFNEEFDQQSALESNRIEESKPKLVWEQESAFNKLYSKFHPQRIVFYLLTLIIILFSLFLSGRIFRLKNKRSNIFKKINSAKSYSELAVVYKTILEEVFSLSKEYSRDDLRASVKLSKLSSQVQLAAILIFDQINQNIKLNQISSDKLKATKESAIKLFSAVPLKNF